MAAVRKRIPKEQRKAEILDAAVKVFAEKGYRNASITDINEAAGIARGTFYLYFDSKKDVFLELVESYFNQYATILEENQEHLRKAFETGTDPLVSWRNFVLAALEFHSENPELTEIVYRQAIGRDEDFSARVEVLLEDARSKVLDGYKLMAERGLLRDVDLEVATSISIGAIVYITMDQVLRKRRDDLAKLADEIVDNQIRALASPRIDSEKAIEVSKANRGRMA
jgi:AcrR family transcriptional regulator